MTMNDHADRELVGQIRAAMVPFASLALALLVLFVAVALAS
jgi:hypothetical protein